MVTSFVGAIAVWLGLMLTIGSVAIALWAAEHYTKWAKRRRYR